MTTSDDDLPHRRALREMKQPVLEQGGTKLRGVGGSKELADQAVPYVIQALLDIATSGMSESARVAACNALLDRAEGKAQQSVLVEVSMPDKTRSALTALVEGGVLTREQATVQALGLGITDWVEGEMVE
jgi:hypothetical protein